MTGQEGVARTGGKTKDVGDAGVKASGGPDVDVGSHRRGTVSLERPDEPGMRRCEESEYKGQRRTR